MSKNGASEDFAEREATIEQARMATAVQGATAGAIADQSDKIVQRMISMYRSGQLGHAELIGQVAELSALDSFLQGLKCEQIQGEVAAMQEFGNEHES